MIKVEGPRIPRSHPDRFSECQTALEDTVIEAVVAAHQAGWDKDEALAAIIEIAENTALAFDMNALMAVELKMKSLRKKKDV